MTEIIIPSTDIVVPERQLIQPGWHRDIPNEKYHKSNGSSSSEVKTLLEQTGAHFDYNRKHKVNKETDTKALGTAFHSLTLEPQNFNNDIAVRPASIKARRGKDWEAFKLAAAGKTIITEDQLKAAQAMARSVREHPMAGLLVNNLIVESSIYWWYKPIDPDDNAKYKEIVKCRPDGLSLDYPVIIDLKSAMDASFTGFMKAMANYYYHVSAAMYFDGVNQCQELLKETRHHAFNKFVFIVTENEAPYLTAVYEFSVGDRKLGDMLYRMGMERIRIARENDWPGFPEAIRETELPQYATRGHYV